MRALAATTLAVTAAALALGIGGAAATRAVTPTQALTDLNVMRARAGLLPVESFLPQWNEGCRLHNVYMSHDELTHEESESSPWWTAAGANAGQASVLAQAESLPSSAWGDSVYHRNGILQPRLRYSGFAASNGYTCLRIYWDQTTATIDDARTTPALTLYPWPPANARDVPLAFEGGETPDPYDDAPAGTKKLGYLVSVSVNGPWGEGFVAAQVSSASLTGDDGHVVPLTIADSRAPNGDFWDSGFGLFPNTPLGSGTTYSARAAGAVTVDDGESTQTYPFDYSWSFTTVRVHPPLRIGGSGRVISIVGPSAGALAVTAHRNASSVTVRRQLPKPGRVTLPLTRGSWRICAGQQQTPRWLAANVCVTRVIR